MYKNPITESTSVESKELMNISVNSAEVTPGVIGNAPKRNDVTPIGD